MTWMDENHDYSLSINAPATLALHVRKCKRRAKKNIYRSHLDTEERQAPHVALRVSHPAALYARTYNLNPVYPLISHPASAHINTLVLSDARQREKERGRESDAVDNDSGTRRRACEREGASRRRENGNEGEEVEGSETETEGRDRAEGWGGC